MNAKSEPDGSSPGSPLWLDTCRGLLRIFLVSVPIYAVGIVVLDRLLPRGVSLGVGVLAIWVSALAIWVITGFAVKNPFRFGLRSMLIATTVVAFLCFLPVYFVRPFLGQQRAIEILNEEGIRYETTVDAPQWLQRVVGPKNCQFVTAVNAFHESELDDELLKSLAGSPHIHELFVGNSLVTDDGLEHLEKMTELTALDWPSGETASNECFKYLPKMKKLRWLDANDVPVGDDGLAHLSTVPSLTQIELNRTQITDDGLKHLKPLTGLKRLLLDKNAITDVGLEHLKSLPNLEMLSLRRTDITDNGLKHLEDLKKLRILRLTDTQVSDAGVSYLAKLPSLAMLDLEDTQVTNEGARSLQEALPECEIFHHSPRLQVINPKSRIWATDRVFNGYYMYQDEKRFP